MTDYNASRRFIEARLSRLVGTLPGRNGFIRGVFLHCTRGGRTAGDDGFGTERWASNPANGGAFWDALIYESGQQVKCTHWENDEQPLWAAGFGEAGTWNAQQFYIHLELGQGTVDDPFPDEQIESLCQWVAELSRTYGFPVRRIPFLDQRGTAPSGICDHENSANGQRLGKSDTGYMFPWDRFIARTNELLTEDEVTREEYDALMKEIASLKASRYQLGMQVFGVEPAADGRFVGAVDKETGIVPPLLAYADADMPRLAGVRAVVDGHLANHPGGKGALDGVYEIRPAKGGGAG